MNAKLQSKRRLRIRREAMALERRGETFKATRVYSLAAELGDRTAQVRLARIERGEKIWFNAAMLEEQGKIAEAVRLYRRAVRLGNLSAMLNLANLLDDTVLPPKPREAVYWYKRGIGGGYSTAAFNLGIHYRNLGQHRWYIHWMKVAARMGESEARTIVRRFEARKTKVVTLARSRRRKTK